MTNALRCRIRSALLAIAFFPAFAACGNADLRGEAIDGVVVDISTNQAVPGALVIARWDGSVGGPVTSSTMCYHEEAVTSDVAGRFHIPAWRQSNPGDMWSSIRPDQLNVWATAVGYEPKASQDKRMLKLEPTGEKRNVIFKELSMAAKWRINNKCPADQEWHTLALDVQAAHRYALANAASPEELAVVETLAKRLEQLRPHLARPAQ